MEYSIQELSRLSGVTTRTLRWYDEIGLLAPSRVAQSGYRYYGDAQVNRLQDILFFRALGVELSRIKECLDDPAFDRLSVLRSHLQGLLEQRDTLDRVIDSVKNTIYAEERNEIMSDEKKFEAFKKQAIEENERKYGKELREKYGDAEIDAGNAAAMKVTREQYAQWKAWEEEIKTRLCAAVRAGVQPQSEEGKAIVQIHKNWLTVASHGYSAARHRGIAQLYVMDERFTAYYDGEVKGCAQFLCDAVQYWIK